jgi:hypothetical protein
MLDVDNALPYLLEKRLIDLDWIIEGNLIIRSAARRNRNLRIDDPDNTGYLIKQPDAMTPAGPLTLKNEVAFYEFCQHEDAAQPLTPYLPRMVLRDPDRTLHALELVSGARTLTLYHAGDTFDSFPLGPSRALGEGLGTLHRIFRVPGLAEHPTLAGLSRRVPWVFRAHRPTPSMLADLSPAGARVIEIIQSEPRLADSLDGLASRWQFDTVIHGDIKADNILVASRRIEGNPDGVGVWIVDWEFVQIGDPAWDLACALHDYVIFWTSSMPSEPSLSPEEIGDQARLPIEALHGPIRALWEGYRLTAQLDWEAADSLLRRSVEFSAVRLIQAASELSLEEDELMVQAVLLLQIAANVVADPGAAQAYLYGIAPECSNR